MIYVIGDMTRGACEVNKGQMQAFINKQLCYCWKFIVSRFFMRHAG